MLRQTLSRIAALVVLLGAPMAAQGQEPNPTHITAASLSGAGTSNLVLAWRYHAGDDPRWAGPAFDDKSWQAVEPLLTPDGLLPRDGWPGSGWFRRHLRLDPALWGKPLVIRVETYGTTEIFLDGVPLMSTGASGLAPRAGGGVTGEAWRKVVFTPRPEHVLAVRHTHSPAGPRAQSEPLGFRLSIEEPETAASERRQTTLTAVFTAVMAFLALLHLGLFLSYPKARENLFYALAMAASTGIVLGDLSLLPIESEAWRALAPRLVISSILAETFFFLLTYYAVRTRAFPRTWIAFAVVGVALIGLDVVTLGQWSNWSWPLYFGMTIVEISRMERSGQMVEREGVNVLLYGFVALGAIIVLQALITLDLVPPVAGVSRVYVFGQLVFAVAMSIFLVQSFARTSVYLERKTSEIEAARAIQLSMLPSALPSVPGLEMAAVMATASEVGGDYYDFRIARDGSLVVAFGDAAGHGVAAGIMVTAVKALFSTLGGGESLPAVLAECDRVLHAMQVKPLLMCLMLARLTPRSVTVCSAAMPPVLIHRAGSGEIEELGAGGPPIGSRLSGVWDERRAPLTPGDTLLFASDGFAEQLDPAENPLTYERAAEAFRDAAGLPASELVERLLARVAAWRGEREQGDDITFVVVRATG